MTRRTTFGILGGILGLIVVLIVSALIVVRTEWFRQWLRDQVVTRASAAINGEVSVDAITGSLFRDVTLHGVSVRQMDQPVIEAESIEARYDAWQLVTGNLQVDRLTLTRPAVRLVRDEQGWNLARLIRTDDSGPSAAPRAVRVSRIEIVGGTLSADADGERLAGISALELVASLSVDADGTTLDLTSATFHDDVSGVPVQAVEATVVFDDRGISAHDVRFEAPAIRLTGGASVPDDFRAADLDLHLTLDGWQARTYAAYLPDTMWDMPAVSGSVSAVGPLAALRTEWNLDQAGSGFSGQLLIDGAADAPTAAGRVIFRNLNPAIVSGRKELDGTITVDLNLDVAVDIDDPARSSATFSAAGGPIALQGYRVESLRADGALANGTLTTTGTVAAYDARTTARVEVARIGTDAPLAIAAAGRLEGLNVARLPATLQMPAVDTAIAGAYDVRLDGDSWSVDFTADESTVEEATIAAGAVVRAQARGSTLDASLSAEVANLSAALLTDEPSRPTVVGGRIDASVFLPDMKAPLDLDAARGQILVALSESVVFGTDLVRADIDASLEGGWLSVQRLDVSSPSIDVTAQGGVAVGEAAASPSDLRYEIDVADMADLPEEWVTGARGGVHVTGTVAGSAQQPSTSGTVNLRQPGYGDTAEALTVAGTFDVTLPDRDIAKIAADVDVEATFVTVGDQELQTVAVTARYEEQRVDVTARLEQKDRSIEVDGGLAFLPDYREVQLRQLTLSGLGDPWHLDRATGDVAVVRYGEDDVKVQGLVFVRGDERISIEGTVGLPDRPATSDLLVDLSGLSVGDLLTLATGDSTVSGTASGRLHLTGSIDRPDVTASVAVVDGLVANVPFTRAEADVQLSDRRAMVKARVDEPNGNAVTIDGSVPVGAGEDAAIDLRVVSSEISLGLVAAATSHLEQIEGTANVDLHVGGTMAAPALTGEAHLSNAAFTVTPTGVRYRDVVLDARLEGSSVTIDRASLSDQDGRTLTMTGGGNVLTTNGERTVDVQVRSDRIRVLDNELGDVALTIDARAQGQLLAPSVSGRIVVDRGRIEVDQLLPRLGAPAAPAVSPAAAAPAAASGTPVTGPATPVAEVAPAPGGSGPSNSSADTRSASASNGQIDVEVVLPDNVVLRGRNIRTSTGSLGLGNMNLTIGGAFSVRKDAEAPMRLVGAVEVVRGFYEFQGRRFEVERGSDIRFRGTDEINPDLNVTGQREVQGITARVQITGTAQRPRITLSSDPPLDEGDVLALVIFNQPMSQLGQSEQVDLMERAGDMALGAIATSLADSIGRALDVDLFEIRAPSSGGAGEVTVGTQLSDRLFVGFRQELGSAGASRLSFEYRLTELLRLLTSVGHGTESGRTTRDREAAGVDLVFRIRY